MNQTRLSRFRFGALVCWLSFGSSLILVGCGPSSPEPVYPVQGEVFVNGRPAVGAEVLFHPVPGDKEKPRFPNATVDADGTFQITTFRAKDGAPPGEYKVTILWRDSKREDGEIIYGPDKLKNRYRNPAKTELRVTVEPENNTLTHSS